MSGENLVSRPSVRFLDRAISTMSRRESFDPTPAATIPQAKKSWIQRTFLKKTCKTFIPTKKDSNRCGCGRHRDKHCNEALESQQANQNDLKWISELHSLRSETDAFGELEFQGAGQANRAKYVRVLDETDPDLILRLLCREWKLELPKLLISVTGGAKSFWIHPKLKQVLRHGLSRAAQTTGAWIITGGTNTGVMKHVGEAVQGHTVISGESQSQGSTPANKVHCIGIATWGIVDNRESLINRNDELAKYNMTSCLFSNGACLDNNHTHFILVDDGTEGKYGAEISLRASLENHISQQKIDKKNAVGIPVVLLVLEGGPNTIRTVVESVTKNPPTPVVIAAGSGRAADILSFAQKITQPSEGQLSEFVDVVEHRQLLDKIEKAFPECNEEQYSEIYHNVLRCVEKKQYITNYCIDEGGIDIDRAILKALLKAQSSSSEDQLNLALVWNRADIARTELFNEEQKWDVDTLESAMMNALVNDRVEFVCLLLENGVCISKFLTLQRLEELYNARFRTSNTLQFLRKHMSYVNHSESMNRQRFDSLSVKEINRILDHLLRGTYQIPYTSLQPYMSIRKGLHILSEEMFLVDSYGYSSTLHHPFNDLLVWAVVCNMHKMALFLWEQGEGPITKALVASRIYMSIANAVSKDDLMQDIADELETQSGEFMKMSLTLLDECYRTNEERAQKLLTCNLVNWGECTNLSLAVSTEHEEFVAHTCCQTLLTDMWMGAMRIGNFPSLKVVISLLFPPFIISLLEFKSQQEMSKRPVTYEEYIEELEEEGHDHEQHNFAQSVSFDSANSAARLKSSVYDITSDYVVEMSWARKIYEFHCASITKFWANVMVYLVFLCLFSYVILIRMKAEQSYYEYALIIFVISLTTEEIRQILQSDPPTLILKIKDWGSSKWNICDAVAISLFFIGLSLRLHPPTLRIGHTVYCIDAMLWVIRLLDIFSVNKNLGPYVVMIGRMTVDMAYFLFIMVVFLLAYGVASHAILFPKESPSWDLLSRIFFRPYFQVYGELFLESNPGETNSTILGTPVYYEYAEGLVTFIMAVYLLIANVLLLNLLIAIFNNTFTMVQANSNQIWKYQRYNLVMEYAKRPVMLPPFIIFSHIYLLIKTLYRRYVTKMPIAGQTVYDQKLKLFLDKESMKKLLMFEDQCLERYLGKRDTLFHATTDERVRVMGHKIESVSTQLCEMNKEAQAKDGQFNKTMKSMEEKMNRLEEYAVHTLDLLQTLNSNLGSKNRLSMTNDEGSSNDEESASLPHFQRRQYNRGVSMPMGYRTHKLMKVNRTGSHPLELHQSETEAPGIEHLRFRPLYMETQNRNPYMNNAIARFRQRSRSVVGSAEKHLHYPSDSELLKGDVSFNSRRRSGFEQDIPEADDEVDSVPSPRPSTFKAPLRKYASFGAIIPEEHVHPRQRSNTLPACITPEEISLLTSPCHVKCRSSTYAMCDVERQQFPDFFVPWEIPFPGYVPPVYTDDQMLTDTSHSDSDIMNPRNIRTELIFNSLDHGVDRRSLECPYDVINGLPRNPCGRTGLIGRGVLRRWGPNRESYLVITRWKRNESGMIVEKRGKMVFEFLARRKTGVSKWDIAKVIQEPGKTTKETIRRQLSLLANDGNESLVLGSQINSVVESLDEVYKGYVDDSRNTDNAWVERLVLLYHDDSGVIVDDLQIEKQTSSEDYLFQEASRTTDFGESCEAILEMVAEKFGAYF